MGSLKGVTSGLQRDLKGDIGLRRGITESHHLLVDTGDSNVSLLYLIRMGDLKSQNRAVCLWSVLNP